MNLKVTLSAKGIQKLIDGVNQYRQDLQTKVETMVAHLAAEGANIARSECPIQTGQLYSSIVDEAHGTKAFIKVNCPYAIFVEMGTGIVGAQNPHPDVSVFSENYPSYKDKTYDDYDSQGHGENGWQYIGEDGKLHWTAGMPSHPFMYNTAQQLKDKLR